MNQMVQYQVAKLDDQIVQEIRQFEQSLKMKTGFPVALVAYTNEQENADSNSK